MFDLDKCMVMKITYVSRVITFFVSLVFTVVGVRHYLFLFCLLTQKITMIRPNHNTIK